MMKLNAYNRDFGASLFTGGMTFVHTIPAIPEIAAVVTTDDHSLESDEIAITLVRINRDGDTVALTPALGLSSKEMAQAIRLLIHLKNTIQEVRQDKQEEAQRARDYAAFNAIISRNGIGRRENAP